jgi:Na+-translocating ferredoxin:NAD+ oxidoreductase RnfC subunit
VSTSENEREIRDIVEKVKVAGVVGAGGAGFPTHVKLSSNAEIVIANGAECEPLLESDRHLMLREARKVITGLKAVVKVTNAKKGVLALKAKHKDIVEHVKGIIDGEEKIELFLLDNFYPAGDEHVLVYEVTGRVVPMGGIPLDVKIVVDNVYTLAMISNALDGKSFTHRYVTVTGEVKAPGVALLPVGVSIKDAIEAVGGGIACDNCKVIMGGPMMGKVEEDLSKPILKTTSAILVLPQNCRTVEVKTMSPAAAVKRSRSSCCQCSFCTDMCPRYLLGHDLNPHKTMRVFPNTDGEINEGYVYSAALCSECGLCGYYSCTMGLAPNIVNGIFKDALSRNGIKPDFSKMKTSDVNMFREDRKVPLNRLVNRMGLERYDRHISFIEREVKPQILIIPLNQHIGVPSVPVVKKGDKVKAGDMVAKIPDNSLGANIHSSMEGIVEEVSDRIKIRLRQ